MLRWIRRVARDTRGGTAIEYGLIAALIVLAMIGAFQAVASSTVSMWNNVGAKVSNSSSQTQ